MNPGGLRAPGGGSGSEATCQAGGLGMRQELNRASRAGECRDGIENRSGQNCEGSDAGEEELEKWRLC